MARSVITGAFGYTGRYIASRLLDAGEEVTTLTSRSIKTSPFGDRVPAAPLDFSRPERLAQHLRGAAALYNTYWVRFAHGSATYDTAVQNTRVLIRAAQEAGVGRFVHVSITNPSVDSDLPYFRGKALLEEALRASTLSWAIVRPTVIFGCQDILINNIAWLLRRLPVFGLFGNGAYQVQPVFVEDFAGIAIQVAKQRENVTVDAVGPEVFTYADMVRLIRETIGSRSRLVNLPPKVALWVGRLIGRAVGDVVITADEIKGLMSGLLVSHSPPTGTTPLSNWLADHANTIGKTYASELKRHYR